MDDKMTASPVGISASDTSAVDKQTGQSGSQASIPKDMAYHTLSKALLFPDIDQYQHWHHVAPMLAKFLVDGKYSIHQQYEYLCLFAQVIVPVLGPYPTPGRDVYRCTLGGNMTVELSQNFQRSESTARIAFEPVRYQASVGHDQFNRTSVNGFFSQLQLLVKGVNIELHHSLSEHLTLTAKDERSLSEEQLTKYLTNFQVKTQYVVALDLRKTGIVVKEYFFPGIKCAATGQTGSSACFGAIRAVDKEGHLDSSCRLIEAHFQQSKIDAAFLCCDLVDPAHTRFKVYIADPLVTLARAEEHWTLGGRLTDENTAIGLDIIRELWTDLGIIEGTISPSGILDKPFLPIMLNYEMKAGRVLPTPKLYMPLTGIPETKIAHTLTAFFRRYDMPEQAEVFMDNLQAYYPGKDLEEATRYQAWLSFAYTKERGPYLSIYYFWPE
ncbi:dimethylallyl tryptophan synthase, putative [Aspergillus udagawae]|uniref:Dimethylallyl tryptophan synthase, putative n=1 Tax=Aspergillus udagawae TaxID=91492 RepID=A0ABQ1A6U3_9EURO|nr:dimethylallyl tryptophan synthase, putative [Aspergillus udagawae]GFG12193.1 dimethylallyl tryptophan synthase, putative [Aspergillus udagawae]